MLAKRPTVYCLPTPLQQHQLIEGLEDVDGGLMDGAHCKPSRQSQDDQLLCFDLEKSSCAHSHLTSLPGRLCRSKRELVDLQHRQCTSPGTKK